MNEFNPTAGVPKTSFNEKSSPSYDNVTWFSTVQPIGKTMTNYNLDNVELKNAEFTANVGDKQITGKVTDKAEAEKAEAKKTDETAVPFDA